MPTKLAETDLPACVVITLAAAKALSAYVVVPELVADSPITFTFDGSNDGSIWVELDWRTDEVFVANTARTFPIISDAAYKYYRLRVTDTASGELLISNVEIFERIASITGHGEAESDYGCPEALRLATLAAEAAAAADLAAHCRQIFTATASRSKTCPLNQGTVTGNGAGASFESQADATNQAEDEAEAKALAALISGCGAGNNDQPITIPHIGTASPYPSVKLVEAFVGEIDKVTVSIVDLSHGSPDDIRMVLQSPAGTCVALMVNCGGLAPPIENVFLEFDDDATANLPDEATIVSGTFKPSQFGGGALSPLTAPAPQVASNAALSAFAGEDPNGYWALWIIDDLGNFGGSISAWDLTITPA